jgi:phage anti-repressor protein
MKKENLKKTVISTYNNNIDYKINKIKSTTPGKPKENIMITSKCCKRLCMVSRNKKAEDIRMCFIELEKIANKYKHYIIKHNYYP